MTPIRTSQSSALAGTLSPEALFLSGFDPETVHLKNVRTAGVCGIPDVVHDTGPLSCFFFSFDLGGVALRHRFYQKYSFVIGKVDHHSTALHLITEQQV